MQSTMLVHLVLLHDNPSSKTDCKELLKCNKEFYHFFNYKTLEDFIQYNSCVCNLFLQDDHYFSLASIGKNTLWTDYIYNDDKEHIISILNGDGKPRNFELSITQLENTKSQYIIIFTDITAMQNEKNLLEHMAYNDPLTNIYNRQMFNKLLIKEKENQKRHGDHLSLVMFDIDHLKALNDKYGHDIGDKVLITLTKLVTQNLRTNDIFARWGGEEFMILLPRTSVDIGYHKAEELRKLIEQMKLFIIKYK